MDLLTFWKENKILLTVYFVLAFFQPLKTAIATFLTGQIFQRISDGHSPRSLIMVLMSFVIVSQVFWFVGHYLEDKAYSKLSKTDNPYLYNLISSIKNVVLPSIISLAGIILSMIVFDIDIAMLFMCCLVCCGLLYYKYRNKFILLPVVITFIYMSFNHVCELKTPDITYRVVSLLMLDYVILNNTVSLINIFPSSKLK